jgi:CBS domain-containing protein
MKVSDLMTRQVATVRANDSAAIAARLMWDCDCGSLPVLDEGNQVSAIVTDRDICMAALFQDRNLSAIPISRAMSKTIQFCGPDDSITSAEQIMRAYQIRRLPVLDTERRLLGILSLADIVRATDREKGRKKEMIPEEVTATLADICTRREASQARA